MIDNCVENHVILLIFNKNKKLILNILLSFLSIIFKQKYKYYQIFNKNIIIYNKSLNLYIFITTLPFLFSISLISDICDWLSKIGIDCN